MKKTMLALFYFMGLFNTKAQNKEYKKQLKLIDKYLFSTSVSTSKFNQSVPFDFDYNAIIIPVTINGKIYHFVFDTGAPTAISDSLNAILKLTQTFEGFPVHDAGGNEHKQPIYNIPDLQIGDIRFNNTGCVVINFEALSNMACTQIDGIIGANLMRTCIWTVDFRSKKLTLSGNLPQLPDNAVALPFHQDYGGSPQLKAYYGGYNFDAGWDSGNNGLFTLPDSLFFKSTKSKTASYRKGNGNAYQSMYKNVAASKYRAIADSLSLGNCLFTNELVEITALNYPIIGTAFMANHDFFIADWKTNTIYIGKKGQNRYDEFTQTLGFNLDRDQNGVHVSFVWEGSAAAKAGLKAGDIIIAIDGKNTTSIMKDDWCNLQHDMQRASNVSLMAIDKNTQQQKNIAVQRYNLLENIN